MRKLALAALLLAGCSADPEEMDGNGGGVEANFSSLYEDYFSECANCHAPGAPGRSNMMEQSLDFSTRDTAYQSLKGTAKGLTGNQADCNGVAFVNSTPGQALVLAVLHQPTRASFKVGGCDVDAVSDMTLKVGSKPSAEFVTALTTWLTAGSPNN